MKTLAERLTAARTARGLTQPELARAAGVKNQSTIGMLESSARKSSSYIPAIANVLNVSALWLADGLGPNPFEGPPAHHADLAYPVQEHSTLPSPSSVSTKYYELASKDTLPALHTTREEPNHPLVTRYANADAATRALIDIALAGPNDPLPPGLSPAMRTLVDMARAAIRAEQTKA